MTNENKGKIVTREYSCSFVDNIGLGVRDYPTGTASSATPSGHQGSSYSPQMSLMWGITSLANSSVFLSVRSLGMVPMCSRHMRWPTRSSLMASVSRSRTVSGLPAMIWPLFYEFLPTQFAGGFLSLFPYLGLTDSRTEAMER